jgi:energy-coupling factor transporter ATP-binding protein EcfA2
MTRTSTPVCPPAPATLAAAGLSHELVLQLLLKHLHFGADFTGQDLARRVGLEFTAIEPVLETLRFTHLCEVAGGSVIGGPSFRYRITDEGRRRALLFLEQSQYVGPAPVPLQQYRDYLIAHGKAVTTPLSRARVRDAFSHLVLSNTVLDQVGPAVAAGHSMFVYGPPGNGKTVIAQALRNLLDGEIAVPHAIEVEGQIIRVFDPVSHERIDDTPSPSGLLRARSAADGRWVRCRRPMVMVGGELTLDSLDLTYSPTGGFYGAPVQTKANGGVLVIDDLGRQRVAARDLLNRWIVPLESRVDFLTLETGQKFDLPFCVMVVFATNIRPSELVDEAFLRRIHYKVFAENPTKTEFMQIFEDVCRARGLAYDALIAEALLAHLRSKNIRFRGCHPRDLIDQALAHAEYLGESRALTPELLEAACAAYFVDDTERS